MAGNTHLLEAIYATLCMVGANLVLLSPWQFRRCDRARAGRRSMPSRCGNQPEITSDITRHLDGCSASWILMEAAACCPEPGCEAETSAMRRSAKALSTVGELEALAGNLHWWAPVYARTRVRRRQVGRTRPVAVVGLGTWTMQHRFRECDLFCNRCAFFLAYAKSHPQRDRVARM